MEALDRTDRQILALLQKDARLSNKELAAKVGLSPSACHGRVRRLENQGILLGSHAEVAPNALGIGLQAMVFVQLHSQNRSASTGFRASLAERPEVLAITELAGRFDFVLHLAVRDAAHLRALHAEVLAAAPEVRNLETALIFEHLRVPGLPDLLP